MSQLWRRTHGRILKIELEFCKAEFAKIVSRASWETLMYGGAPVGESSRSKLLWSVDWPLTKAVCSLQLRTTHAANQCNATIVIWRSEPTSRDILRWPFPKILLSLWSLKFLSLWIKSKSESGNYLLSGRGRKLHRVLVPFLNWHGLLHLSS